MPLYRFLQGGGEMGALIRATDWSQTSVGRIETWPQSLCTAIGIMLNNHFPMYIAWGNDFIQFYNDGYQPILGSTKHPQAMGRSSQETFAEIWDIIGPIFDDVMNGKAVGFPDFMLPLNRNGYSEECYFDFSYSPIRKENGDVGGVLIICKETTETIQIIKKTEENKAQLEESEKNFRNLVMHASVGICILKGEDFLVEVANDILIKLSGKLRENLVGRPLWESLPEVKSQGFDDLLKKVMYTGVPYHGNEHPIRLEINGVVQNLYLNFVYKPLKDTEGNVDRIFVTAIDVTSLVESRHLVEDAEERARLAIDAVGLGTFDLNLTSGEMITSPRFANIFGFDSPVSRAEYVSHFHPGDLEMRLKAHRHAIESGKLFYKGRVIYKDKTVHWVRVEGKVFYNSALKAVRILGMLIDITEQKQVKEEQQKLLTLADNSVDLMSILNIDGTNSYINKAGRNLLGFESEEQVKLIPISELHSPEDFELVQNEVLPTVMSKGRWSGKMMVRHLQTGEIFPVFNNCTRIDDPVSGTPIAVGSVMRDLRPELASKQALADSEQLLRNITTAAPTSLWMSDEKGYITYFNQTWVNWTGFPYEENMGTGWLKAIVPEDRERAAEKLRSGLDNHSQYEVEFRLNHADGTIHWCVFTGQPQYRDNGTFAGYIGACTDITEQKYLQQQKDEFIGIASHELKTPVTSIKAYAQVLEKILEKKGDIKEAAMISKMDAQINRLTSLISDLLDVTKINSGRLQFNDDYFDFNQLVKDLIEDLQHTTSKHTLVIEFEETGIIYADKERIGQVITNLISNAIKYSPQSSKIVVHTYQKKNEVHLCVQDYGIGISKEKQEKVFEQFYRVSGEKQHTFPGLGLGLYISSEIIKREGGRIWVDSVQGEGSNFYFSLPNSGKP